LWLALVATLVHLSVLWSTYGRNEALLQAEAVELRMIAFGRALRDAETAGARLLPHERRLFDEHPQAYGYAILDGAGRLLDAANPGLLPPEALIVDVFADDWIARRQGPDGRPLLVASSGIPPGGKELRAVFVMADDPARLLRWALLNEFWGHAWLPVLPVVLALLIANSLMISRGLAPLARAARWARALRPGEPPPPPPDEALAQEIADLVEATARALGRLHDALEAERRRTAEAAHALRTPVAVLAARLDALPAGPVTERLRGDVAALARMVAQILEAARAETLAARPVAVDLAPLAEEVVAELVPFAFGRGVELGLVAHPEAAPALAMADPIRLALRNLVENAVIHGRGPVEVVVGPGPRLAVRDAGPGLGPEAAAAAFEPFWRGEEAEPGGAGLGLAIVARIQQSLGGEVEAGRAPGGGAEFRLSWPAAA
jgi:two-component system OmpR family sensor kinase